MKKKAILLSILSLFVLSGCNFFDTVLGWFKKKEPTQEQQDNEDSDAGYIDTKRVGEFYGGVVINDKYNGYEFSRSKTKIEKPTEGTGVINIYAFNDFHGAVKANYSEPGLKTIGTFFKEKSQQQNTLILDQGDTWQGSLESNYEYGAIVQDVFNYAGVSLRTVGNHDFDWGLNHLESTNNRKLGDDYIPTLAANVFDYIYGYNGGTQQSQCGMEYATFILDNGIKVGVVGVIGEDQITSICSNLVSSVCFTNHFQKAREISDYLRIEKNCDVIIVSAHESAANLTSPELCSVSPVSHKRYADLILGGHSHYQQEYTIDGVKCVQWDSNGESTGYIKLNYDFKNNCVLDDSTRVQTYSASYLRSNYSVIEETIDKMVDDYLKITDELAFEVLSNNFTSSFDTTSLANLMSEAIFDAVKTAGYTIDFAVTNYARTGFYDIEFTYGDLYRSFPFDNQIILMDISSQTSINSLSHNMTYREDTTIKGDSGQHRIAVIDYIGLHQNNHRQYDYFPDATNLEIFNPGGGENPPIYRNILKDYLKNNTTKVFSSDDYSSSNAHFRID
ncbi:MAG: bifunctional metallophosphatase/5'-nucleotidase [Bacilli bacterium]|nr:bifunctional metallophosphatase/5'-nucleotidase [Bacilli bacterium]